MLYRIDKVLSTAVEVHGADLQQQSIEHQIGITEPSCQPLLINFRMASKFPHPWNGFKATKGSCTSLASSHIPSQPMFRIR